MADFWTQGFVQSHILDNIVIAVILVLYYLYYNVKHHEKMRLLEHSFYLAMWVFNIVGIIVLIIFSFIPMDNSINTEQMMSRVGLGVSLCACVILEPIRARKVNSKAK